MSVTLQPVSMRRVRGYEPTTWEPARTMTESEFVATLADTAKELQLITPAGLTPVTAYGPWAGWWWVVDGKGAKE